MRKEVLLASVYEKGVSGCDGIQRRQIIGFGNYKGIQRYLFLKVIKIRYR